MKHPNCKHPKTKIQPFFHPCLLLFTFLAHSATVSATLSTAHELTHQASYADTDADSALSHRGARHFLLQHSYYRFRADWQHNSPRNSRWAFDLNYLLYAEHSAHLNALRAENSLENDIKNQIKNTTYFDGTDMLHTTNTVTLQHQIARANLSHTNASWTVKLGRQAITWGNGAFFQTMDLFDPFSPEVIDTRYKPGVDMLYAQHLFADGSDVQFLWVPRHNRNDAYAAKWLRYFDDLQAETLLARDANDKVLGWSVVHPIGGAIWKLDWVITDSGNDYYHSIDLNAQYSWQWGQKPLIATAEYYRNGFASDKISHINALSPALLGRLARGQIFTLGKDHVALSVQTQWAPLLIINSGWIYQANDHSQLWLLNATYNHRENATLLFGTQVARGHPGTQYGGYYIDSTNTTSPVVNQPPSLLYVRYEFYF